MGNENNKQNYRYHSKNRTQSIVMDNFDFASFPQMPAKQTVEAELNEILTQLILEPDKEQLIRSQPIEVKWKVICRHREVLKQNQENINKAAQSPVQMFLDKIQENPSLSHLEDLRQWLEKNAKNEDISSFLAFNGLNTLMDILENAEINSHTSKCYNKQILVLKCVEFLVNANNQVINKMLESERCCQVIVRNLIPESPEVCNSVYEIFNALCWSSHSEGHNEVMKAFNHLKTLRKYKYPFQPLIEMLQEQKNIIIIENTIAFLNTLVESSVDDEERRNLRFQLISCNIKLIYEKIREKILNEQYYIDDCIYEDQREQQDSTLMKRISQIGKTVFIEKDQDEFEKHILQVINQIEVFEKATEEGGDPSSVDLSESMMNRRQTREKIDFTNINTIFEKLKNDSMTNNTFSYFLEILNYMVLIPRNENGSLVWEKMASVFAEATNLENEDWDSKLKEFQTLVQESRNIEELEEFNTNLQTTLSSREQEIDQVIAEKNKYQKELTKFQKETEEIIKKYQAIELKLEETLAEKDKIIQRQQEELQKLKEKDTTGVSEKFEARIKDLESILAETQQQLKTLEANSKSQPTVTNNDPVNIPLPPNLLPNQNQVSTPPPLGLLLGNNEEIKSTPPPPPIGLIPGLNLGTPPPPIGLLLGPNIGIPPPPNMMLPGMNNIPLPPPNLISSGPPPLNLLMGGGGSGPPPLNLLMGGGGSGPPPLNLLMGGKNAPPLLMPMVNQAIKKVKEKKKPRIPMRGLMWTVIASHNVKETMWEEVNDETVELDIDLLEREFAAKKPAVSSEDSKKNEEQKSKMIKVSLLPPEKTKNMEIVLGKLKMSNSTLKDALNQMNDSTLNINNIESLLNIVPIEEEIKTVEAFEGDPELLGAPERFALEISKIPGFKERLLGIKFVKTYEDLANDLTSKVDKIFEILNNIPKDEKFKTLAEHTLAIGNYLNGTTARGGAYGFQLDALEKLNDLKMITSPKKTLLMYIIAEYEKKHGCAVIEPGADLSDLEMAAKTPISQLQTDLGELRKGAKNVSMALKKAEENDEFGKVEEYFKTPYEKINQIIENIEKKLKECEERFLTACKYLCENPKDTPSDKLIEKIWKFWVHCKNAKTTLNKEQEMLKKEEEKKKKEQEKSSLKPGNTLKGMNMLKIGTPEEIVETLKNRRQTKRIITEFSNKDEIEPQAVNMKMNLMDEMRNKTKAIEKLAPEFIVSHVKEEAKREKSKEQKKHKEESPVKISINNKPAIEEKKIISPLFKKADVKGGELEAHNMAIKVEKIEGRRPAPLPEARVASISSKPKLNNSNTLNVEKKPEKIDYLSVLKKNKAGDNKPTGDVNYLANILTDGAIKKSRF